jgi:fumarylpyruvate hydrolase
MTYRNVELDKIICVGKNYLDHAIELGDAVPDKPTFFFKPPSCLVQSPDQPVPLPKNRGSVHHECEIVYRIRRENRRLFFDKMTLGLDLTLRDVQNELKKKGHPWEASKAFAKSAIIGPWLDFHPREDEPFELKVNGQIRQSSTASMMRVAPSDLLVELEGLFTVCDGDLLFTGTPKGVGPIASGDQLTLRLEDRLKFDVNFD